jgi:hypothetical protein
MHFDRRRNLLITIALIGISTVAASQTIIDAQEAICRRYHETARCGDLVAEFYSTHGLLAVSPASALDFPPQNGLPFAATLAPKAIRMQLQTSLLTEAKAAGAAAMQTISTTAATNQVGSSSSANGSTNLVSKPTTTDFISFAAESGAFTSTLNGSATTLQANALGLSKYISGSPVFVRWNSGWATALQPLNFTVSMTVAQSGSSSVATTGTANSATPTSIASVILPSNNASFNSFGATYVLYRPYNPQSKSFQSQWTAAIAKNQSALNTAVLNLNAAMAKLIVPADIPTVAQNMSSALITWQSAGAAAEKSANLDAFVAAYAAYDEAFADYILSRPGSPVNALAFVQANNAFSLATETVLTQARGTPLATIGYLYSTPVQQPPTHQFSFVISELFRGGGAKQADTGSTTAPIRTFMSGAQLTANFTTTIYASIPSGATYGRLRDLQASAEFDKPFGGTLTSPRGTFSFAGYGQYQYDPTVLNITAGNTAPGTNITLPANAQVLLGTSGWLGVVQGKVSFNLSQGLSLPIAIKWSNKTDLLDANDVRGQIGLSYDLSALSKLLTGNSK